MEGIAVLRQQKEKVLKVFAKYSRLNDPKQIQSHYQDAVKYLETIPRIELRETVLNFMGKNGTPLEAFADKSVIDRLVREGFIEELYNKR